MNPSKPLDCRRSAAAFTLVELLVVVAIVAILAAMLLPALSRAKAAGIQSLCLSNLRQISIGEMKYINDSDEYFTPAWSVGNLSWDDLLDAYLENRYTDAEKALNPIVDVKDTLFRCPGDNVVRDDPPNVWALGNSQRSFSFNAGSSWTNVTTNGIGATNGTSIRAASITDTTTAFFLSTRAWRNNCLGGSNSASQANLPNGYWDPTFFPSPYTFHTRAYYSHYAFTDGHIEYMNLGDADAMQDNR